MRDPDRIQAFCNELAELWRKVPDWRFGQLLCNVIGAEFPGQDIFFPEDNVMMNHFRHYFEKENV